MSKGGSASAGPGSAKPADGGDDKLKKLEGRVAELEDKIRKLTVTEEEWKTFLKVSSVLTGQGGLPASAMGCGGVPQVFVGYAVLPACTRPCFLWMTACVVSACRPAGAGKPGDDFGDLGKG
jgi:hypothetical protein